MKTIAIMNNKGGTYKTSTALALCHNLTKRGYRVLAVDSDHQAALSSYVGYDPLDITVPALVDLLLAYQNAPYSCNTDSFIQKTKLWFHLIPGSYKLSLDINTQLPSIDDSSLLKKALSQIAHNYDFCIIDTPPSRNVATNNILEALDYIIIPSDSRKQSFLSLQILQSQLFGAEYAACSHKISGILPLVNGPVSSYSSGNFMKSLQSLANAMDTKVFNAVSLDEGFTSEAFYSFVDDLLSDIVHAES